MKTNGINTCSGLPPEPLPIRAIFTESDPNEPGAIVEYDLRAAAAVLSFTEKHCC
jgi:hypothetical protein